MIILFFDQIEYANNKGLTVLKDLRDLMIVRIIDYPIIDKQQSPKLDYCN